MEEERILFEGGKIHTGEEIVECMIINKKTGLVEFIGKKQDIPNQISNPTKKINISANLILPGFIDSHIHVELVGEKHSSVDLRDITSIKELKFKVQQFIE